MVTFAFTKKRGRQHISGGATLTFTIYKMVRNVPKFYGETKANSASYYGDTPTVGMFIADKEGWKLTKHKHIKRKDVKIVEL